MSGIILKRANVVKRVDSEDKAKALEAKGFVRADGKTPSIGKTSVDDLKAELVKAGEVITAVEKRKGELEKELAESNEKMKEASGYAEKADKKIEELTAELSGTKEQLEAAVKKNKAADKK